jgi:hypothetical protein
MEENLPPPPHEIDFRLSQRLGSLYHIECSSARQLVVSSVKVGLLQKHGAGSLFAAAAWAERFVVLRMAPMLMYYRKDTDTEPQKVITVFEHAQVKYLGAWVPCCPVLG